jgi:beta-galactosidase
MNLINGERITLGVCYYPEHWQESEWETDLKRMLANGIETVRIAEFAWSLIEPEEGVFDYHFFDRFLEAAERTGMKVIFCTPTATPPAWLTKKYPEVLNTTIEGVAFQHGFRRHYNYNSPKYQELTKRIVEHSAAHYGSHPAIIGWQIDNEFNCEVAEFYSESDTKAFQQFLKEKYGTLETLNQAWGTVFWNQTYTRWEEVDVPRITPTNRVNPHRKLDYYRFISQSVCHYAKIQSDILRKYIKPGDFITTNGIFGNLDSHRMTEESLDFITYDSYPNFSYCLGLYHEEDPTKDRNWSKHLSEVRSISKNFGIMEQQSGANGSMEMMSPVPKPGQITLWTMQSVAHGADFISYFRWRTATMGTEMYWHGILDYSGRDNRRLAEIKTIHEKLKKLDAVAGAVYTAQVAILRDYDNVWNNQADVWQKNLDEASIWGLYQACQHTHTPYDYVYLDHCEAGDLSKYKVVFYPHGVIMTKERAALLQSYVGQGGTLVFGCRTAYKDIHGICVTEKLPGLVRELTGTDIPEYTVISPEEGSVKAVWGDTELKTTLFNDQLAALEGAEVVASYDEGYYKGAGALVHHQYGKGETYYYGSVFTADVAQVFLEKLKAAEPYREWIEAPKDIEIALRNYLFVLNYSREEQTISLKKKMRNVYTGQEEEGEEKLAGYETRVYEI